MEGKGENGFPDGAGGRRIGQAAVQALRGEEEGLRMVSKTISAGAPTDGVPEGILSPTATTAAGSSLGKHRAARDGSQQFVPGHPQDFVQGTQVNFPDPPFWLRNPHFRILSPLHEADLQIFVSIPSFCFLELMFMPKSLWSILFYLFYLIGLPTAVWGIPGDLEMVTTEGRVWKGEETL